MRDISFKVSTLRVATARAVLTASPETLQTIREGRVPKGDPLSIAKSAAVTAAKKTTEWIPYCHNIPIEFVSVEFELLEDRIIVDVCIKSVAKTGVEMEAMTAAAAAALTLYDMLKMIDDDMEIVSIRLLEKIGGKSDFVFNGEWSAGVLTVSDRASSGVYEDRSGETLVRGLNELSASTVVKEIVPDDATAIQTVLKRWINEKVDIILVTGGTGIGPRDITPQTVEPMLQIPLPGVVQALRQYGQDRIKTAMFSRSVAGVTGSSVIVAIPGSPAACEDALSALFPALLHAKAMLIGGGHS
ncbi:MAG: bifunctional molybdenum cofactor biosynthesis protein MoaC/MoaB [Armatimonadota bacterium]